MGSLIYGRISRIDRGQDPELECTDPNTGKAEDYGEVKGGMVFPVSAALARRLLGDGKKMRKLRVGTWDGVAKGTGLEVLEELGKKVGFEIAVGRNGRVWVDSEDVRVTVLVGRCLGDAEFLTGEEGRRLVRERVRELGIA